MWKKYEKFLVQIVDLRLDGSVFITLFLMLILLKTALFIFCQFILQKSGVRSSGRMMLLYRTMAPILLTE
jgi:hypothetical protein